MSEQEKRQPSEKVKAAGDVAVAEAEVVRLFDEGRRLHEAGEDSEAYQLFQDAFVLAQEQLPSDHPRLASAYANLAMVEQNPMVARRLLSSALKMERRATPPDQERIVALLSNLAVIHQDLDEPKAARRVFEEAISILESMPKTHSRRLELASLCFQLAVLLQEGGENSRASELIWSSIFLTGLEQGVRCEPVALYLYHLATLELKEQPSNAFLFARVSLWLLLRMEERTDRRFFETLAQRVRELERGEPCTEHTSLVAAWIVENDSGSREFFPELRRAMEQSDPVSPTIESLEQFLVKLQGSIGDCRDW